MREPSGVCVRCQKRPGTTIWIGEGGVMDYIHGGGVPYCQRCVVECQLEYARKLTATIPDLERQLAELP